MAPAPVSAPVEAVAPAPAEPAAVATVPAPDAETPSAGADEFTEEDSLLLVRSVSVALVDGDVPPAWDPAADGALDGLELASDAEDDFDILQSEVLDGVDAGAHGRGARRRVQDFREKKEHRKLAELRRQKERGQKSK